MRWVSACALLALVSASSPAFADDTSDCIAASEAAQSLRDRQSLLEARERLAVCSRDVCPGPIRADCLRERAEVDAAMPSIVFRAKDAHGEDAVDVKVFCDGDPLAAHLDGKALPVNPGAHTFRFEAPGEPPVERKVVIVEGEKNRLVVADVVPVAGPVVSIPEAPAVRPSGRLSIPGLVVGGIGVAAVVPMAVFWALGTSDIRQMRDTCAPSVGGTGCSADRVSSDRTKLIVGDVFMGVAAVGIATGAVLMLTHQGGRAGPVAARLSAIRLEALPTPGGALVSAGGGF